MKSKTVNNFNPNLQVWNRDGKTSRTCGLLVEKFYGEK